MLKENFFFIVVFFATTIAKCFLAEDQWVSLYIDVGSLLLYKEPCADYCCDLVIHK